MLVSLFFLFAPLLGSPASYRRPVVRRWWVIHPNAKILTRLFTLLTDALIERMHHADGSF